MTLPFIISSDSSTSGNSDLALALVLYGMLSYALALVWAVNVKTMRLRTYQMIGHSLSMFVGVLMFQTFNTLINDLFQGGDPNENSSDIPLSVIIFLLWNVLGLFLIWKFHRNPRLQKGCLIIIGHTAGFACINVATIVQTSSFAENDGMAVLYVFLVLLVLLVGYAILYFLLELFIAGYLTFKERRKRRRDSSLATTATSTPHHAEDPAPPDSGKKIRWQRIVALLTDEGSEIFVETAANTDGCAHPKRPYIDYYYRRITDVPSLTKRSLLKFRHHMARYARVVRSLRKPGRGHVSEVEASTRERFMNREKDERFIVDHDEPKLGYLTTFSEECEFMADSLRVKMLCVGDGRRTIEELDSAGCPAVVG
ncbi:hypothetical protein FOL47_010885 [Perkinsus chesapeaki]|uniref:Uncharacterized protein n=1 Tax=Perkinsus chesapeaki TaxID=330153 RepID=A0A7J6MP56_PERCH|nr:hypothetical protein FOL47_010885 [Perkinsus chesapeaki]